MAVCGCLMGLTSLILMFLSMANMLSFRDDFDLVMDQLEAVDFEVKTVRHDDFNGLVHVIIDKDVFDSSEPLWEEDYSGDLNWLSGKYMQGDEDPSPEDFKKSRRTYMVLSAINLATYTFVLFLLQLVPKGGQGGAVSAVTFVVKGIVFLCQYQIMMPYTVAQKHEGELILFYIPGTLLIVHAVLNFLTLCILVATLPTGHPAAIAGGCCCYLIFLFVAGIPVFAVSYDYLPNFVNTMHSDYSEALLFNTEYYDKSWLAQECMLAGLGLDLAALVLDICVDNALGMAI